VTSKLVLRRSAPRPRGGHLAYPGSRRSAASAAAGLVLCFFVEDEHVSVRVLCGRTARGGAGAGPRRGAGAGRPRRPAAAAAAPGPRRPAAAAGRAGGPARVRVDQNAGQAPRPRRLVVILDPRLGRGRVHALLKGVFATAPQAPLQALRRLRLRRLLCSKAPGAPPPRRPRAEEARRFGAGRFGRGRFGRRIAAGGVSGLRRSGRRHGAPVPPVLRQVRQGRRLEAHQRRAPQSRRARRLGRRRIAAAQAHQRH
ncbi:hypothetical protein M885DRAFT_614353, partial [Pelagophyceae sp. CCMP2097]